VEDTVAHTHEFLRQSSEQELCGGMSFVDGRVRYFFRDCEIQSGPRW
jgi:hypothetical protein